MERIDPYPRDPAPPQGRRTPPPVLLDLTDGRRWPLQPGHNSVGRRRDAMVCIEDLSVSRLHCTIEVDADLGRVLVRSEAPANPPCVEGVPVSSVRTLQIGETLRLGNRLLRLCSSIAVPASDPEVTVPARGAVIDPHGRREEPVGTPPIVDPSRPPALPPPPSLKPPPPPLQPPEFEADASTRLATAGVPSRLAAGFLDLALLALPCWGIPILAVVILTGQNLASEGVLAGVMLTSLGVTFLLHPAYFGLFDSNIGGGTFGKRAFRVRTVRIDGGAPDLRTSLFRSGLHLLCLMPLGAGMLTAFFHPQRRGIHELLSGTRVIRRSS